MSARTDTHAGVTPGGSGPKRPEEVEAAVDPPHLETHPITFERILLLLNWPPQAELAVEATGMIARILGGAIEVMHVLPEPARHGAMGGPDEAIAAGDAEKARLAYEQIAHNPALYGLKCTHSIERGELVNAVLAAAVARHFDLVVVSDPKQSVAARVIWGSSAELLARRLGVPVLLLGPEASVGQPWKSILLATALSADSLRPAQYAISIASQLQCDVTLEHVLPYDPWLTDTMRADLRQAAERRLEELLPAEAGLWCHPHVRLAQGDIAANILEAARETEADLVVLGLAPATSIHSDHHLATVIGDVVREAGCPVLVVPPRLR